ncbi:type II toxin-antitoxin system PemK/MazF family toxin [soil metagenome]
MACLMPFKGEVWNVNLDPTRGHEQAKIRPCVVISNDQLNTRLSLSIVVPFTSSPFYTKSGKLSPAMVEILPPEAGLSKPSYTLAFQVRSVSHVRFIKKIGALSAAKLEAVVNSVQDIIAN